MTGLRSGEVAAAAGVNPQTLRYYERRGLLAEPDRTLGGHRLYPTETVTVLRVIKAAQRLGFTLDEVAGLLHAGHHRRADAGLRAHAEAKLAEIESRIADLQVVAGTLRDAIDAGCDDLVTCAEHDRCPIPFAAGGRLTRSRRTSGAGAIPGCHQREEWHTAAEPVVGGGGSVTDGAEEQAPAEESAGRPLRRGGPRGGDTALAALQEEARRRLPTADLLDRVAVRARRP